MISLLYIYYMSLNKLLPISDMDNLGDIGMGASEPCTTESDLKTFCSTLYATNSPEGDYNRCLLIWDFQALGRIEEVFAMRKKFFTVVATKYISGLKVLLYRSTPSAVLSATSRSNLYTIAPNPRTSISYLRAHVLIIKIK